MNPRFIFRIKNDPRLSVPVQKREPLAFNNLDASFWLIRFQVEVASINKSSDTFVQMVPSARNREDRGIIVRETFSTRTSGGNARKIGAGLAPRGPPFTLEMHLARIRSESRKESQLALLCVLALAPLMKVPAITASGCVFRASRCSIRTGSTGDPRSKREIREGDRASRGTPGESAARH